MKVHKTEYHSYESSDNDYTDYEVGDLEMVSGHLLKVVSDRTNITHLTFMDTDKYGKQCYFSKIDSSSKLIKNNKLNKELYKDKIESENEEYLLVRK